MSEQQGEMQGTRQGRGFGWLWMIVIRVLVGLAIAALVKYLGKCTERASNGLHH